MPYIPQEKRYQFEGIWYFIPEDMTAGELNYVITKILKKLLGDKPNYARYNELIGALECCKLELVRKQLSPYEDEKEKQNGKIE
jgi:hypothetical protein